MGVLDCDVREAEFPEPGGPMKIGVAVGDGVRGFSVGDLLNAVDELVCYFQQYREQTDGEIAAALRLYADRLDDGDE